MWDELSKLFVSFQVFEINNVVAHLVHNRGNQSRVHLIMDVAEQDQPPPVALKAGMRCHYKGQHIVC
jgi:hypothetical protein